MELMELTEKLIRFPGTTQNKPALEECFNFCVNYFKDKNNKNIFIDVKEKNGLKSVLVSNADTINLDVLDIVHIDVVPVGDKNMYNPIIKDGILKARGSSDMKSQVAVAFKLFEYVIEQKFDYKYGLLIVTDEETECTCSDYWASEIGLNAKIILDGDGAAPILNKMIYKKKASLCIKVIFRGESAHGSRPWIGVDANENLIQSWSNLRKVFPYINKDNKPADEWCVTLHAGVINGGKSVNSISDYAELYLDFRYIEGYNDEKIFKIIRENFVGDYTIEPMERGVLLINDTENKYFKLYKKILEKNTGKEAVLEFGTGASDSRFFSDRGNDVAVIASMPIGGGAHTEEEWLNVESLYKFLDIRKEFLRELVI
jgi:succinyl-diaminopimelate desuccinylase